MSKRDQILSSALTLFNAQGFEKTPTSAISRHAGVATGTLFHHFPTKEALIDALYLDIKTEVRDVAQPDTLEMTVDSAPLSASQVKPLLKASWLNMMEWMQQNPEKFRFLAQFGESAYISNNTRETVSQLFRAAETMFHRGIESGIFRPLSVELLTSLMGAHMYSSINHLLQQPTLWQRPEFQQQLFDSCWGQLCSVSDE
jgi:AcrR family transcriptional regulator